MKNRVKLKYKEKLNGKKTEEYMSLCKMQKTKEYTEFDIKKSKKDNIQLRVFKNNAIINIKRVGSINYDITHKENIHSKFFVNVLNDKFEQIIYTKHIVIKNIGTSLHIDLEFLKEQDLIKCMYEFEIKEVE